MDAYTALLTRRSIRKYTDQPVSTEDIDKILTAAMLAPSARNKQPWHFVVIDDADLLRKVPQIHPNAAMAAHAPCAILVCGNAEVSTAAERLAQDCAAATENALLAAHALGLGAVWCGIHPMEDRESGMRILLSLPQNIVPFALVVLGHPAEEKEQPERYDARRVHRNGW